MLTRARLRSQSGTNVDRDFVELPSQIHEHWALEPELLKEYAFHYKTGELIPDSLVAKLQAASTHNQGLLDKYGSGAACLAFVAHGVAEDAKQPHHFIPGEIAAGP